MNNIFNIPARPNIGNPYVDFNLNRASAGPVPDRRTGIARSHNRLSMAAHLNSELSISKLQYGTEIGYYLDYVASTMPGHGGNAGNAEVLAAIANLNNLVFLLVQQGVVVNDRLNHIDLRLNHIGHRLTHVGHRLTHMDVRLNQIDVRLNHIDVRLNQIDVRLNQMDIRSRIIQGRQANSIAEQGDPLVVICREDGQLPPDNLAYPATYRSLLSLPPLVVDGLLEFYGHQDVPEEFRVSRLRMELGYFR